MHERVGFNAEPGEERGRFGQGPGWFDRFLPQWFAEPCQRRLVRQASPLKMPEHGGHFLQLTVQRDDMVEHIRRPASHHEVNKSIKRKRSNPVIRDTHERVDNQENKRQGGQYHLNDEQRNQSRIAGLGV
jgi:hypothetical protein